MSALASYHDLIASKRVSFEPRGFSDVTDRDLIDGLFDHQKHGVEFALRAGCAALFYDTGLGKTAQALNWGQAVKNLVQAEQDGVAGDLFAGAVNQQADVFKKPDADIYRGEDKRSPKSKEFIAAIDTVCREYDVSLGHEDHHGAFIVQPFSETNQDWLSRAFDETSAA